MIDTSNLRDIILYVNTSSTSPWQAYTSVFTFGLTPAHPLAAVYGSRPISYLKLSDIRCLHDVMSFKYNSMLRRFV